MKPWAIAVAGLERLLPQWYQRSGGPLAAIVRRYGWGLPVIAILGLAASIFETVGIGLIIPLAAIMLNNATGRLPRPIMALIDLTAGMPPSSRILALSGFLIGFVIVKGLVQAASNIFIETLDGRIARDVQNALCRRVLELDYPFFLRTPGPRLVNIISTESWYTAEVLRDATQILTAAIALTVFAGMLVWLNWFLALIILVGAVLIQSLLIMIERKQRQRGAIVAAINQVLAERMLSVVAGMRAIRIFGQQDREFEKFADAAESRRVSATSTRRLTASVLQLIEALVSLLFVAVLIVGYTVGGATIPQLLAFLVLVSRAQPYAKTISRARVQMAALNGSVREVEWLLSQETAPISLAGSRPIAAIDQPIRFDHVSYRYPGHGEALADLSLAIHPGVVTALIGQSGSGKTTLVNLLCRLVEPTSGTIFHGALPIREIAPDQWRSRIAIAGQDIELSEGTIAENIAYGVPNASQEEIELAALTAGADGFVRVLEQGYATRLELDSVRLSGGQRQRIGLARALLRRPDLLVLDEAISAVDSISESEIVKLLTEHRHFRTALLVSHRKSTLTVCQDCIVLDGGRLVQAGPLAQSDYFSRMI